MNVSFRCAEVAGRPDAILNRSAPRFQSPQRMEARAKSLDQLPVAISRQTIETAAAESPKIADAASAHTPMGAPLRQPVSLTPAYPPDAAWRSAPRLRADPKRCRNLAHRRRDGAHRHQ